MLVLRRFDRVRGSGIVLTGSGGSGVEPHRLQRRAVGEPDRLSMVTLRSVATRAGIALTRAQRDFGSRDRLVAVMVQHVLTQRATAARNEVPADALTRLAEDEWNTYRAHPWLVGVMASTRPPLVPAALDASRAAIEAFMGLGLDSSTALNRYLAFSAYIQGMGLLLIAEQQESVRSGTSYRRWWTDEVRRLARTGDSMRHPWLLELTDRAPVDDFDPDAPFRDGLSRVIRGLTHRDT